MWQVYLVFWTLSYLTFSSMSNLPRLLIPFGLQHTLTPLQHPICHACSSLLDFLMPSRSFNVQSAALSHLFWTSAYLSSASTSNPSCLCTSQQKVDTTLYFYTSFNEHNTPYTVLESDNSESMPDVLH